MVFLLNVPDGIPWRLQDYSRNAGVWVGSVGLDPAAPRIVAMDPGPTISS
jgi:hypothetical protein